MRVNGASSHTNGCVGTGGGPTSGSFAGATLTVTCPFASTVGLDPYGLLVIQSTPGGGDRFPYTVDFKVDGVTIPGLSGTMQPVEAPLFDADDGTRFFRFRNDGMQGTIPTATELEPAKGGDFLSFVMPISGTNDLYEITPLAQPTALDGSTVNTCGDTDVAIALPAGPAKCEFYANDNAGAPEYRFYFTAKGDETTSATLEPFRLNVLSNGIVIPGGPVVIPQHPTDNFLAKTFLIRADSGDGPIIMYEDNPPFVLKITYTAGDAMTLTTPTVAPGGFCDSLGSLGDAAAARTVMTSCRDYAAGDYDFQVAFATGPIGAVFEFFYDGVLQPDLSGTTTSVVMTRNIRFAAPATRGDPLTMNGAGDPFVDPAF